MQTLSIQAPCPLSVAVLLHRLHPQRLPGRGIAAQDHVAVLHDSLAQGVGRPVEQDDVDTVPGRQRQVGESHGDPYPQIAVKG